jgi:DNA replication and repair protein RecF
VTVTAPLPAAITDETSTPVTLETISLRDFRNLARVTLAVPREGMAIVGDNGHGKTNLLEAIYYLQLLRSVRGARDQDVVRFGAPGFHVAAEAVVGRRRVITAAFQRVGKRKKVTVDGIEPPRLSDALGSLPSVMFSPRDVELVAGAPSERRRFLDVALALTSRRYLAALQQYRAALVRRNAALRDAARKGETGSLSRAAVWEPALAEHGALLWAARVAWVERVADDFARLCANIGERGVARMRYATSSSSAAAVRSGASAMDLAAHLAGSLEAHRAVDLRRGLTHVGPHRDDLELTLDGHQLRAFGSAGQQRTASIALRLLEAATLRAAGSAPLVLLDDPFAELDATRAARILDLLETSGVAHQTILAVPRSDDIPREMTSLPRFRIVEGAIGTPGESR